jgi:hypothetical protein
VSPFADGDEAVALAAVLWPTIPEKVKNRPAATSNFADRFALLRWTLIEPFILRLRKST